MGMFVVAPASSFHHHHHHHDNIISAEAAAGSNNAATTLGVGVGVGVIPLLTATPCLNMAADEGDDNIMVSGRNRGGGIQWQNQLASQHHYYMRKPAVLDHGNSSPNLLHSSGGGGGLGVGAATTSSSTATCQDCGNQAKKDCSFRRCRTCCKSRGFDCSTHVRSTWVPASRRRERQLMTASATAAGAGSSTSTSGTKKPRLITSQTTTTNSHTSTSNTTPPRSFDTGSSRQDASFKESLPGQVRAPAVFKCVRVTAVDDGEDEYAYQGVVKISGHVFKGFLYDQGIQGRSEGFPNISELHLGSGDHRNGASSASPIINPADVYASGAALIGGPSYGNPIN